MKKLYCPVRRLEKPGVNFDISRGKDDLINIDANIRIKDPVEFVMNVFKKRKQKKEM